MTVMFAGTALNYFGIEIVIIVLVIIAVAV